VNEAVFPRPRATALLVVDVQERLLPAMFTEGDTFTRQVLTLVATATELQWPVTYTEQYPKGLGATVPEVADALGAASAVRIEKLEFSCCRNPVFAEEVLPNLPSHVVVAGMEAHICVLQTVVDLQARGHQVFVPHDAVSSRTRENHANGLALMERAGAVVSNVETLLFAALERAGTDAFKRLSRLVR